MNKYTTLKLVLILPVILPAVVWLHRYFNENTLKYLPKFIWFYVATAPMWAAQYILFAVIFINKFPKFKKKKLQFSLIPLYFSIFNGLLTIPLSILLWNSSLFVFGVAISGFSILYGYLYIIPLSISYYLYENSNNKKSNK